jgi:hypothetical protein
VSQLESTVLIEKTNGGSTCCQVRLGALGGRSSDEFPCCEIPCSTSPSPALRRAQGKLGASSPHLTLFGFREVFQFSQISGNKGLLLGARLALNLRFASSGFRMSFKGLRIHQSDWLIKFGGSARPALKMLPTPLVKVRCGTDIETAGTQSEDVKVSWPWRFHRILFWPVDKTFHKSFD